MVTKLPTPNGQAYVPDEWFSGYDPTIEPRELLFAECIDFDVNDLLVQGDLPDTRGIKNIMRRDDQGRINSCSGFGMTGAGEVAYFLQSSKWRQFNPMWSYRRGQEVNNIRTDSGATIQGVVKAAKEVGFLPEDMDGDGNVEVPYREDYGMRFPSNAAEVAAKWKVGYSINLRGYDEILKYLQANQGAVIVGGSWGNWRPNARGIANSFASGGGGHARCYVDWITIDGVVYLVECNSHYSSYGDNGFAYHSKQFVDQQAADRFTVTVGVSDLSSPEPRFIDWSKQWLLG
jgi:hypothetical protein